MTATDARKILGAEPYAREVLERVTARTGDKVRLTDNPIDGVCVVRDDEQFGQPFIVELTDAERALLLIAVGKAYAKLVRES